jgi:tetraacyldisaccharide 4'-kinase
MRAPEFWHRGGPMSVLLAPLGWAYGAVTRSRMAGTKPIRAGVPVLCIGNLTAGGTGKTPVALDIGARLVKRGAAVHFLSRGYGGTISGPHRVDEGQDNARAVGDEALLLAAVAPTWIGGDRVASAHAAVAAGAGVLVMDDGFQNPGLAKDFSILVVDGAEGFGNERLIPAGPLRETVAAGVARAQAMVILGEDRTGVGKRIAGPRILAAAVEPGPGAENLADQPVVAFAGIGRPAKFFDTLRDMKCDVRSAHAFADHHLYRDDEIARLEMAARNAGAILVTTAKDALRLPKGHGATVLPISIRWADEDAIDRILDGMVGHG